MTEERIILVQLADIHFHDGSDHLSDIDRDVRHELERDLALMRDSLGPAHEILIAGDIAYSAKPEQYTVAEKWIRTLRKLCDCENIRAVPGNHDVDRSRIKGRGHLLLRKLRQDIRSSKEPSEAETKLQEYLEDDVARPALYSPLDAFNQFAKVYRCHTGPDESYWKHDLLLNDRSTLRIYGMNSVLISDDNDHWKNHPLILGQRQCQVPNEPGVTYLTLCHHPPHWLLDQISASRVLNGRAAIQLYGHTHSQWIEQVDQSLRIISGATHPDRKEDHWQPRYNYLSLAVVGTGLDRKLDVRVYSRVWSERKSGGSFMADHTENGDVYHHYQLKLAGWASAKVPYSGTPTTRPVPTAQTVPPTDSSDEPQRPSNKMSPQRRLTYQYLSLPYLQQIKVAQDLDLLKNEDQGIDDVELFGRIYHRAKQQGKLARLWDAVVGDAANPFQS